MDLVTGGTGLVGSHILAELVKSGRKVRAIKRPASDLSQVNIIFKRNFNNPDEALQHIEWVDVNLLDPIEMEVAMEGIEDVYHAAAIISFLKSEFDEMYHFNQESTATLVNAALHSGVRKVCVISSIASLGRPQDIEEPITEDIQWKASKNNSGYARSKYAAEQEAWRGAAEGLKVVIVNPSVILGISNPEKGSSKLFKTVWNGVKFYPTGMNGYVDVKDVAGASVALMESDIEGERFVLSAENVNYKDLLGMMADAMGKPRPTIEVSKILTKLAWRFELVRSFVTRTKPFLTRETARTSRNRYRYSSKKIETMAGYSFRPIQETIAEYGNYYKDFLSAKS